MLRQLSDSRRAWNPASGPTAAGSDAPTAVFAWTTANAYVWDKDPAAARDWAAELAASPLLEPNRQPLAQSLLATATH